MENPNVQPAAGETPDTVKPKAAPAYQPEPEGKKAKGRSTGLWLFDAFLYPFLSNTVVFVVSVAATYLTKKGNETGGWLGKFFHSRREKTETFLKNRLGWGEKTTESLVMVGFSFLDGSIMAPFIKLLEDRREKIAHGIDKMLGTTPEDLSVYAAEPKQSWGSVFSGRVAALSVVLPTALLLDRIGTRNGEWVWKKDSNDKTVNDLNDKLFRDPGEYFGNKIKDKPIVKKALGKLDIPMVFRVSFFEAFYTTACTTVLYFASRSLARIWPNKNKSSEKITVSSGSTKTENTVRSPRESVDSSQQEKTAESNQETRLNREPRRTTDYVPSRQAESGGYSYTV
jgi:hypothetical protein